MTSTNSRWPLSFAQQRLWFLDRLTPGSAAYHMLQALRLRGDLDAEALRRSLSEIVRRHQVLRTRFVIDNEPGEPMQEVSPAEPLPLATIDISDQRDPEGKARELVDAMVKRTFNLSQGPLLRVELLRLGPDDHVLLINTHHIVTDGWSSAVFIGELTRLYSAITSGQDSPFEELPWQYHDFAVWQRESLLGDQLERHLQYWREQLSG